VVEELTPEPPVMHRYEPKFTVTRENGIFIVAGKEIERRIAMTNMENEESVERLQGLLKRSGIVDALVEAGVKEGDTVQIGPIVFEYAE
jgi:GTP-binding protein